MDSTSAGPRPASFAGLLLCFILSGGSALIYEVAWVRSLELVFGSTTFAVATVLAAFMGGLAGGSYCMGRQMKRLAGRHPLKIYAVIEILIAVVALLVPWALEAFVPVYRWVWQAFDGSFFASSLARFCLSVLLLLVPTFLMGATLPVVSALVSRDATLGQRRIGFLYAANTLGAVLGCAGAGLVLFPLVGLAGTQGVAMVLNLVAAGGAWWLATSVKAEAPSTAPAEAVGETRDGAPSLPPWSGWLVAVYAGSGFIAMVYEVAWSRVLVLTLGSSTYAYTIMLTTFLLGLALGAALAARWVNTQSQALPALGLCQLFVALTTYLSVHWVEALPYLYVRVFDLLNPAARGLLMVQFLLAFSLMILPTLGLGAMFPITLRGLNPTGSHAPRVIGWAYALNTLGAILGSVMAGFWLIPMWGSQATLLGGVVFNLLLASLPLVALGTGRLVRYRRPLGFALLALGMALVLGTPRWDPAVMSSGVFRYVRDFAGLTHQSFRDTVRKISGEILMFEEGLTCTVTIFRTPDNLCLQINGKPDATTPTDLPNPYGTNRPIRLRDLPTQTLAGQLPMLFASEAREVLVVGLGSGVTLNSVLTHPVGEVECIELEDAVVQGSRFFGAYNHDPLGDPRTRLIVNDARNHLLVTDKTYDVIVSEPSNPWIPGAANLFTREFFELTRSRLSDQGVFGQWIQLYELDHPHFQAILRSITEVFPRVHVFRVQYDSLLVATLDDAPLEPGVLAARFHPAVRQDLSRIGIGDVSDLLAHYWIGGDELIQSLPPGPLNTDDNMLIEFAAPLQILSQTINRTQRRGILAESFLGQSTALLPHLKLPPDADQAAFWAHLGERAFSFEHLIEAELYAQKALQSRDDPLAARILGQVLVHTGRKEAALELLETQLRHQPHAADLLHALAWIHSIDRRWPEARNFADTLIQQHPDHDQGRFLLGKCLYYLNDIKGALDALQPLAHRLEDVEDFADLPFYLGALHWARHEYGDAAGHFSTYLKRDPSHLEARAQFADSLYHLGQRAQAMAQWQLMGQIGSADAQARFHAAQAALEQGQAESVLAHLEAGRALDPWNEEILLQLAQIRHLQGKPEEGIRLVEQFLSWKPDQADAVGLLGELSASTQDIPRSSLMKARYRSLTGRSQFTSRP